jgi:ubiquinone/menaquinone biosynthesis C-methylase UbiE
MADVRKFYDSFWVPRDEDPIVGFAHQRINNRIEAYLNAATGTVALDVGCGEGYITLLLVRYCHEVISMDISRVGVKSASKHIDPKYNCSFIVADAQHLPFRQGAFNILVLREVIEHLTNQVEAVKEMSRVLTCKGTLILTTPNKINHDVTTVIFKVAGKYVTDYEQIIENQLYPAQLRRLLEPMFTIKYQKGAHFTIPIINEYLRNPFLISMRNWLTLFLEKMNTPSVFASDQCLLCINKKRDCE